MTLFARHDPTYKSHKWSSNVQDAYCRDGDKMLCKNDLGYFQECFVHNVDCFLLLHLPSTNIKINYNECIYIGKNNED